MVRRCNFAPGYDIARGLMTWTFEGQSYLRWPRWVQEACGLGRCVEDVDGEPKEIVVPTLRGQVVRLGERLVLLEDMKVDHEMGT